MGDFACFCLYFEVNAFKSTVTSLHKAGNQIELLKKINHLILKFVKKTLV